MEHDYYAVRRGCSISIRCRHCRREWDIKPGWNIFFMAVQAVIPVLLLLIVLLFRIQFPSRTLAVICTVIVLFVSRNLPPFILQRYMRRIGKWAKFIADYEK